MKKIVVLAALAVTGIMPAVTVSAASGDDVPVVVSCFRGPWKSVIWDHPNEDFIESLMANGFSYSRAVEIGERVCRDAYLVDHSELMVARTQELIEATPRQ